ncbi:MAG: AMP-binding protein [Nevskiaceae bacterium]|jgi:long-chain acyl-CoA synthetase|nr:AMP-binding protein [Nevskiaceae bacterium]
MDRIWLKQYPPGVPADIDSAQHRSLKTLIESGLQQHAARDAYVQMDKRISFADVDRLSAAFATWLQHQGLKPGDRVALMMPNLLQYPIALFGVLRAGLVAVNTNPLYTADELRRQLNDSGAQAIVVVENFAHVVAKVKADTALKAVLVTGAGDLLGFAKRTLVNFVVRHVQKKVPAWNIDGAHRFTDALRDCDGQTPQDTYPGPEDVAILQYTGGTTGTSKGATLTHRNMIANALQARAWFEQVNIQYTTYYIALPMYHIFSLTGNCLLHVQTGGFGVIIPDPRDFAGFVKVLRKYPPQVFLGVNTLFNALMSTAGFDRIDFTRLVASIGGGMAVQAIVAERWKKLTGCTLSQGWGLTETSPVVTVNKLLPGNGFNGSVGLPVPSTDVSIRDDEGNELGINEVGEICVHGPQVMAGYWQRPAETAQVMLPGDWLRTGDVGRIDSQGYVYIEDRKKDMITVSGFKVYPNEVEDVAVKHPDIFEAAAIAEPDERSGEVVALYVVSKNPSLTAEQVIAFTRQHLTAYKVPRHVYFREQLPKTNVGKILRRALRPQE